jgi:hypothetical protein
MKSENKANRDGWLGSFTRSGLLVLLSICAGFGIWLIYTSFQGQSSAVSLTQAPSASAFVPESTAKPAELPQPTYQNIENIRVGMRVLTPQTQSGPESPTAVNPSTWRKVTLSLTSRWPDGTTDEMMVETLQPPWWLRINQAAVGRIVLVPLDLSEMGVPDQLAEVKVIEPCPAIQAGSGEVVLTTVNHLNNYLYRLTLTDGRGRNDVLGVTGWHKIYTEDRGWISASDLKLGEVVRGASGDLAVAELSRNPGAYRVYNMTVESEHVYFVGELAALVHNVWCDGQHHVDPKYLGGDPNGATVGLPGQLHQLVHSLIDDALQGEWGDLVSGFGRNTELWSEFFLNNEGAQETALQLARDVLADVLKYVRY